MIELRIEADDLWFVTLNRPDKANALTPQMLTELLEVMDQARAARGVILTGAGKVFSAGADLEAARAGLATSPLWEEISAKIAALPCLTVAALNGTVAGGANGMVLACDLRISVPTAKVFYPVITLGYQPQPSDVKTAFVTDRPGAYEIVAGCRAEVHCAGGFGVWAVGPDCPAGDTDGSGTGPVDPVSGR